MNNTGIARLPQYLNVVDDALPGQSVSGSNQTFDGQVGAVVELNAAQALKLSNTSVGNSSLMRGSFFNKRRVNV